MSDERRSSSRRKILGVSGLALAGAVTGTSVASTGEETGTETGTAEGNGGNQDEDREEVLEIISGSEWSEKQRTETKKTMDKYGVPEGTTERRLIWYDADPWRRIEIFRETWPHDFPASHPDFFEQFIDYQVPAEKADELTEFDGSVMFERTTGLLSGRCHTEWANTLSINLAHDVIIGQKTVEEARRAYGEMVIRKMNGESPAYTQGFQFELPGGNQRDPGVTIIENGEVDLQGDSDAGTDTETTTEQGSETTTDRGTETTTD